MELTYNSSPFAYIYHMGLFGTNFPKNIFRGFLEIIQEVSEKYSELQDQI
jgi:hypothetical protein